MFVIPAIGASTTGTVTSIGPMRNGRAGARVVVTVLFSQTCAPRGGVLWSHDR